MSRRFTLVTVALTAVVAFLVGAIVAGGLGGSPIVTGAPTRTAAHSSAPIANPAPDSPALVSFADVVQRINPAVVNVDATLPGTGGRRRRPGTGTPGDLFDRQDGQRDSLRRGA